MDLAQSEQVITELQYTVPPSFSQVVDHLENRVWSNRASSNIPLGGDADFFINSNRTTLIPSTTCIRFRIEYTPGAGGTLDDNLLSSAYSLISEMRLMSGNNQVIAEIPNNYNVIMHMLTTSIFSASERHALSSLYAFDSSPIKPGRGGLGAAIVGSAANQKRYRDVCLPIMMPFIGANAAKYFPSHTLDDLRLYVKFESSLSNICLGASATAINRVASIQIQDLQLVYDSLQLTRELTDAIQSMPMITLKSNHWSFNQFPMPSGTSGSYTVNLTTRFQSLKSIFVLPVITGGGAVAAERNYAHVSPNLKSCYFVFNGKTYPQQHIDGNRPAELAMNYFKAWNALTDAAHINGLISEPNFFVRETADALNMYSVYDSGTDDYIDDEYGHCFRIGLNLETLDRPDRVVSCGLDTRTDNSQFVINVDTLTRNYNLQFVSHVDIFMLITPQTKQFRVAI